MSRFNPNLAALALSGLEKVANLHKVAFVPMGPNAQVSAQQEQSAQQQQQAQGGGQQPPPDPAAAAQAGAPPAAAGGQPPPPGQPQGQPPGQPQPGMDPGSPGSQGAPVGSPPQDPNVPGSGPGQQSMGPDDMRAMMKEEIAAGQEKPQKLPIQDRVTQLEGLVLRLMEYHGMVKPDPNLTSPVQATSVDSGGVSGNVMPQVGDVQTPPGQAGQAGAPMGQQPGMAKAASYHDRKGFNIYLRGLLKEAGYMLNTGPTDVIEQLTDELIGKVENLESKTGIRANPDSITQMGKVASIRGGDTPLPSELRPPQTKQAAVQSRLAQHASRFRQAQL